MKRTEQSASSEWNRGGERPSEGGKHKGTAETRDGDSTGNAEFDRRNRELIVKLRGELAATRQSVSFRLGNLLVEALVSPWRKGRRLPVDLHRLVRDYLRSSRAEGPYGEAGPSGLAVPENTRRYLQPGIEEHWCDAYKAYSPVRETRSTSLKIGCVVSEHLFECLDWDAELLPLKPEAWETQLAEHRPDLVIVEAGWRFSHGDWAEAVAGGEGGELQRLVAFCQERGIPACFWDTHHHTHCELFEPVAQHFDFIFAADPKSAEHYGAVVENSRVRHLPPAVQPALHNPARPAGDGPRSRAGSVLFDGWADALEWPESFSYLEKLIKHGLRVVESRYRFVANKLDDLPALESSILGNISYRGLLTALREYRLVLMTERSLSSPLTQAVRAMEAAACGARVMWLGSPNPYLPEGVVARAGSEKEITKLCGELLEDRHGTELAALWARRIVLSEHTYVHRLREICRLTGIDNDWEEFPPVSVITPTKRPDYLPAAHQVFRAQSYPNKEWVVLVNTDVEEGQEDSLEALRADPAVQVIRVHGEHNIGACLNLGIRRSNGRYWFKMDDDDFYGPHYVADMMLELRGVEADIFGKPTAFVYLEAENLLIRRGGALNAQHLYGCEEVPHMCGATISGRRESITREPFSEQLRASVDTEFMRRCKAAGLRVYLSSIYGFAALRQGDKSRHTWRADDSELKRRSATVGGRSELDHLLE
ncbi:glycosyltransferase [Arhodomonas sp. AD133]|uniref:glycosyltransferase n=1 Tax=Arhodomonas sp. AD133 TaxID=3415009 RepID=UPI003EBEF0D0